MDGKNRSREGKNSSTLLAASWQLASPSPVHLSLFYNLATFFFFPNFSFPFLCFLAALAALYLTLVTQSLTATLEFWHKEWLLRLEALRTYDQSDVWQKDEKTKIQKDIKTERQRDKNTKSKKRVLYCDVRAVSHSCDVFFNFVLFSFGVGLQ